MNINQQSLDAAFVLALRIKPKYIVVDAETA